MKKILLFLIPIMLLFGCEVYNTPTAKVEEFLMKYQKLDQDISKAINDAINEQNFNDSHATRYTKILEKQYKNLSYKIKDEIIDGDNSTVIVELEVLDYKNAINDLIFDSSIYSKETFDEEKLNRLENTTNKVKYTLELSLTKQENNTWKLNDLTNEDIKKIQGMY